MLQYVFEIPTAGWKQLEIQVLGWRHVLRRSYELSWGLFLLAQLGHAFPSLVESVALSPQRYQIVWPARSPDFPQRRFHNIPVSIAIVRQSSHKVAERQMVNVSAPLMPIFDHHPNENAARRP